MWTWFKAARRGFAQEYVADPLDLRALATADASQPVILTSGGHTLELNDAGSTLVVALMGKPSRTWKWVERVARTVDVADLVEHGTEVVSALTEQDDKVRRWAAYALTHRRVLTVERGGISVPLTPRGVRTVVAVIYADAAQLVELAPRILDNSTKPEPQAA